MKAFANGIWFTAAPARLSGYHYEEDYNATDECKGCVFRGQLASACRAAGDAATAAGMPDCESRPADSEPGHIYRKAANDGD